MKERLRDVCEVVGPQGADLAIGEPNCPKNQHCGSTSPPMLRNFLTQNSFGPRPEKQWQKAALVLAHRVFA